MILKTPEEFLQGFKVFEPADHHYSGPPGNHQAENNGSVFHIEGKILATLAHTFAGNVLEIGADQGVSTRYIHEGLEASGNFAALIYSVDNHHKWPGPADSIDPEWPRRRKIDGDSGDYTCPAPAAWAFIDGGHQYRSVIRDITTALRSGCKRLLFHDASDKCRRNPDNPSSGSDVREAVPDYFTGLPGWYIIDVSTPCGLFWVFNVD